MMGEEHGLRRLQMGVAGHDHVVVPAGQRPRARRVRTRSVRMARDLRRAGRAASRAPPGRCGCARYAACPPTGPIVSIRRRSIAMWMSSSPGRARKRPVSNSARIARKAVTIFARLGRRDDALAPQHLAVGDAALDVVGVEAAVDGERGGEGLDDAGRGLGHATRPRLVFTARHGVTLAESERCEHPTARFLHRRRARGGPEVCRRRGFPQARE